MKNYNMASSLYNNGAEEIFKKENMKLGEIRIDEANKYKEKANSNREDAIKYLAQFELQFGINSENQKLVDQAHQILDLINKIVEILEFYTLKILDSQEPQAPFPEVMKTIANYADYYITDIFVKNCRLYYKREWDKAKGVNSGKELLHYVEVDEDYGYVKSYRERSSLIESIVDGATIT